MKLLFATLVLLLSLPLHAEKGKSQPMSESPKLPPEVQAYLAGATTAEHLQFDFLIGSWSVTGVRFLPDGSRTAYQAQWDASYINDKRMVVDDFKILSPQGTPLSSYVTLRSYSPISQRWELSGLAALAPAFEMHEWYGQEKDGEMILTAKGVTPDGKTLVNKIRFYDIAKDAFQWESSISLDDGKTWIPNGTLEAKRQGSQ